MAYRATQGDYVIPELTVNNNLNLIGGMPWLQDYDLTRYQQLFRTGNFNGMIYMTRQNFQTTTKTTTRLVWVDNLGNQYIFAGADADADGGGGGGSGPALPNQSVQYNNGGSFGGSSAFTFDGTNVNVGNNIIITANALARELVATSNVYGLNGLFQNNVVATEIVARGNIYAANLVVHNLIVSGNVVAGDLVARSNVWGQNAFFTSNVFAGDLVARSNVRGQNAFFLNGTFTNNVSTVGLVATNNVVAGDLVARNNVFGQNAFLVNGTFTNNVFTLETIARNNIYGSNGLFSNNIVAKELIATNNIYGVNGIYSNNLMCVDLIATGNIYATNFFAQNMFVTNNVVAGDIVARSNSYGKEIIASSNLIGKTLRANNVFINNTEPVYFLTGPNTATGPFIMQKNDSSLTFDTQANSQEICLATIYNNSKIDNSWARLGFACLNGQNIPYTGAYVAAQFVTINGDFPSKATADLVFGMSRESVGLEEVARFSRIFTHQTVFNVVGAGNFQEVMCYTGNVFAMNVIASSNVRAENGIFNQNVFAKEVVARSNVYGANGIFTNNVVAFDLVARNNVYAANFISTNFFVSGNLVAGDVVARSNVWGQNAFFQNGIFSNNAVAKELVASNNVYGLDGLFTNNVVCTELVATGNIYAANLVVHNLIVAGNVVAADVVARSNVYGQNAFFQNGTFTNNVVALELIARNNVYGSRLMIGTVTSFGYAAEIQNPTTSSGLRVSVGQSDNNATLMSIDQFGGGQKLIVLGDGRTTINGSLTVSGNTVSKELVATSNVYGANGIFSSNVLSLDVVARNNVYGINGIFTNNITSKEVVATNNVYGFNGIFTNNITSKELVATNNVYGLNGIFTNNITSKELVATNNVYGLNGLFSNNVVATEIVARGNIYAANLVVHNLIVAGNLVAADVVARSNVWGQNAFFQNGTFTNNVITKELVASNNVYGSNAIFASNILALELVARNNVYGINGIYTNNVVAMELVARNNVYGINGIYTNNVVAMELVARNNVYGINGIYTNNVVAMELVARNNVYGVNGLFSNNVVATEIVARGNIYAANLVVHNLIVAGNVVAADVVARSNVWGQNAFFQNGTFTNNVMATELVATMNVYGKQSLFVSNAYIGTYTPIYAFTSTGRSTSGPLVVKKDDATTDFGGTTTGQELCSMIMYNSSETDGSWARIIFAGNDSGHSATAGAYVAANFKDVGTVGSWTTTDLVLGCGIKTAEPQATARLSAIDATTAIFSVNTGNFVNGFATNNFTSKELVASNNVYGLNGLFSNNVVCKELVATGNIYAANLVIHNLIVSGNVVAGDLVARSNVWGQNAFFQNGTFTNNVITKELVASNNVYGLNSIYTNNVVAMELVARNNVYGINGIYTNNVVALELVARNNVYGINGIYTNNVVAKELVATNNVYGINGIYTNNVVAMELVARNNVYGVNGLFSNNVVCTELVATGNIYAANLVVHNLIVAGNLVAADVVARANVWGQNAFFQNGTFTNNVITKELVASNNVYGINGIYTNNVVAMEIVARNNVYGINGIFTNNVVAMELVARNNVYGINGIYTNNVVAMELVARNNVYGINGIYTNNVVAMELVARNNVYGVNGLFSNNVVATEIVARGNIYAANLVVHNLIVAGNVVAADVVARSNVWGQNAFFQNGTFTNNVITKELVASNNLYGSNAILASNVLATELVARTNVSAINGLFSANALGVNIVATSCVYGRDAIFSSNGLFASNASGTGIVVGADSTLGDPDAFYTRMTEFEGTAYTSIPTKAVFDSFQFGSTFYNSKACADFRNSAKGSTPSTTTPVYMPIRFSAQTDTGAGYVNTTVAQIAGRNLGIGTDFWAQGDIAYYVGVIGNSATSTSNGLTQICIMNSNGLLMTNNTSIYVPAGNVSAVNGFFTNNVVCKELVASGNVYGNFVINNLIVSGNVVAGDLVARSNVWGQNAFFQNGIFTNNVVGKELVGSTNTYSATGLFASNVGIGTAGSSPFGKLQLGTNTAAEDKIIFATSGGAAGSKISNSSTWDLDIYTGRSGSNDSGNVRFYSSTAGGYLNTLVSNNLGTLTTYSSSTIGRTIQGLSGSELWIKIGNVSLADFTNYNYGFEYSPTFSDLYGSGRVFVNFRGANFAVNNDIFAHFSSDSRGVFAFSDGYIMYPTGDKPSGSVWLRLSSSDVGTFGVYINEEDNANSGLSVITPLATMSDANFATALAGNVVVKRLVFSPYTTVNNATTAGSTDSILNSNYFFATNNVVATKDILATSNLFATGAQLNGTSIGQGLLIGLDNDLTSTPFQDFTGFNDSGFQNIYTRSVINWSTASSSSITASNAVFTLRNERLNHDNPTPSTPLHIPFRYAVFDGNAVGNAGNTVAIGQIDCLCPSRLINNFADGEFSFSTGRIGSGLNEISRLNSYIGMTMLGNTTISTANGSTSLPGYNFRDQVNTGIARIATNQVNVISNATRIWDFETGTTTCYTHILPSANAGTTPLDLGSDIRRWDEVFCVTLNQLSDEREKKNIQRNPFGLHMVENIPAVIYQWNKPTAHRYHAGFRAQDIKKYLTTPMDITEKFGGYVYNPEHDTYSLRFSEFIPVLWKAVQELSDKMKKLTTGSLEQEVSPVPIMDSSSGLTGMQMQSIMEQVGEMNKRMENLEIRNRTMMSGSTRMTEKILNFGEEHDQIKMELDSMKKRYTEEKLRFGTRVEVLEGDLDKTRDELDNTKDELSRTNDELSRTSDELEQLKGVISEQRSSIANLEELVKNLSQTVSGLLPGMHEYIDDKIETLDHLRDLDTRISEFVESKLSLFEKTFARREVGFEVIPQIDAIQKQLRKMLDDIQSLAGSNEQTEAKIEELSDKLGKITEEFQTFVSDKMSFIQRNADLASIVDTLRESIQILLEDFSERISNQIEPKKVSPQPPGQQPGTSATGTPGTRSSARLRSSPNVLPKATQIKQATEEHLKTVNARKDLLMRRLNQLQSSVKKKPVVKAEKISKLSDSESGSDVDPFDETK